MKPKMSSDARSFTFDYACRQMAERGGQKYDRCGAGASLLDLLESWNVTDERSRLIPNLAFARLVSVPDAANADTSLVIACIPAFIKLKWEDAALRPAKVYYQFSLACR